MIHPLVEEQFAALKRSNAEAEIADRNDGAAWVTVPGIQLLPDGSWNKTRTPVMFLVPLGYPQARPDCFFVDVDVRLASGGMPANSNMQPSPQNGQQLLWFSWHVASWNPNVDSLLTYLNVIRQRLREAR